MNRFLSAHGYDPGPTQRPVLAGLLGGLAGTVPALPVLAAFGSLRAEAQILGLAVTTTIALGCLGMSIAGAIYGRLLQRAANDRRGGWLFGMTYSFLLWSGGAVMVLPLISGGATPAGGAAVGVFLALETWGLAVGSVFPYVQRLVHRRASPSSAADDSSVGPLSVASHSPQRGT